MPRKRRCLPVGMPAHIIQRGVNRQICFASDEDMAAYANWLREGSAKFGVLIHAWVFMSNHVHLLLTPTQDRAISDCMQYLGRLYVRYFNDRYKRTGTLFEDRFKSHTIQTTPYLMVCSRYIELNPVRGGLVKAPSEYRWSSYCANAWGQPVKMWTPHEAYESLGSTKSARQLAYRRLFESELGAELISEIKRAQQTGFVLGTEKFRAQFEELTGFPQSHKKRGRKRNQKNASGL